MVKLNVTLIYFLSKFDLNDSKMGDNTDSNNKKTEENDHEKGKNI